MATQSLGERLLELKAGAAQSYAEAHGGDMTGFAAHWAQVEGEYLVMARKLTDEAQTNAKSESKRAADEAKLANLRRSTMTAKQVSAFVKEHGADKFKELPE